MSLGKYLSSLTKPEVDELEKICNLSDEEKKIFMLLSRGKSITEISMAAGVSTATVKRRIKSVTEKIKEGDIRYSVPIWEKMALTVDEAAAYSNIGINKIYEMVKNPRCPFVLYVGKKRLIKRKEFERFVDSRIEI